VAKTQSVATGTAHKLKLDESARVPPLAWRATSRNVIKVIKRICLGVFFYLQWHP
jgi:hypothetical protein